ncbi:MBL fold metallo-hydrolase [Novosphingobium sp. TH158]|uniref:MBL fold metallo-hydrolase n=1 Tax=Novosphingobium sp. TH158 TaxID=2067455 RepID=UPI000C7E28BA|nr:MBL fold metallo-hydrolase [Novosphingobium sp. TH158]PLK26133.1 hypothetical protein C0V78_03965 [Novosphingobium sp. TH158]
MTRRINLLLLALLLILGGPVWYLLLDTSPWRVPPKDLRLAEARRLAEAMPGPRPERISLDIVAWKRVPGNLFAAGSGFKRRLIAVMAFRLDVPGRPPIMIDSGMTRAYADELGMEAFDEPAQARVNKSLREAGTILFTHEHADHLGGLAALAGAEGGAPLLSRVMLNPAQAAATTRPSSFLPWPQGTAIAPRIGAAGPQAVAPGVVVIPTPGHTPGSQMIYVRLASGKEYLFAGDTAVLVMNWQQERPPSRLLSDRLVPQDRAAMVGWLRALKAEHRGTPALAIVPGHDSDWILDPGNGMGFQRIGD